MNAGIFWRAGIIAAGDGARLRAGGWAGSKAMAPLGGRPLIDHALDRFGASGIERVSLLINEASRDCAEHVAARRGPPAVDLVVRTTPSSFASFALLAARLSGARTVISTVDAILPEHDFASFLAAAAQLPAEAIGLGVTRLVDDEAPLWAELDAADGRIVRLGGAPAAHVTAGFYALPARLPPVGEAGFGRLRDYLGRLVQDGYPVYGIELPQVFDVDRAGDLVQAEQALASWRGAGEGA
ncbi:MAG: putative Nucleotidyl transferase [Alphaproteobacteria bacterium]|nr:putative Nucleotidyl transferase [Alphaproteobacteria bacterium]